MPRSPRFAPSVARIPGAVYSPRDGPLDAAELDACPLHVGDTWLEPFIGGRMEDLHQVDFRGLNRYSEPRGLSDLIDAIVDKVRSRNRLVCERDAVWVTAGATGALSAAVGALASPGEEVLLLAPFWPLIRGIVQTFRGRPVEVPFYDRVDSPEAAVEALRERVTKRTAVLYVSTPSNPTGRVLPPDWLEALAAFARDEDLWLLSDEVYEDYVYRGDHVSIGRFAPERTLTAFSFSKAYGLAGNRTGYLVGPAEAVAQVGKVSTHTVYSAPTAGQVAGLQALRGGGEWVENARVSYGEVAALAASELGLPPPEGSTFLFIDVSHCVDERGLRGFLSDCLEDNVALAPGSSCGEDYEDWVRLCYTSAPPTEVLQAIGRLSRRLQRVS